MSGDTEREALHVLISDAYCRARWGTDAFEAVAVAIMAKFLPEHDKRVKAEAWDEAQRALIDIRISGAGYASVVREPFPENPYRRES